MKVQIKTWEEMVEEFELDDSGDIAIRGFCSYTKEMEQEMPEDRIIKIDSNMRTMDLKYHYLITQGMIKKVIPEFNNVAEAIKSWLSQQDDKTRTIMVNGNKSYSAQDLITEIENQTTVGKELEQSIIELTIDLLFRKKETL